MRPARALRLLLAAALLMAWQVAQVHPLAHVDDHGELVHLDGGHDRDSHGTADPLCDAIAALAVAIGAGQIAPDGIAFENEVSSAEHTPAHAGARQLAYRSQAPPQYS